MTTARLYVARGGNWVSGTSSIPYSGSGGSGDGFTLGVTKPTAGNTGTLGTPLTTQSGDVTITTAGVTVTGLDIHGFLIIKAANVTVTNCHIRGRGPAYVAQGLVDCTNAAATGVTISRCEVGDSAATTQYWWNGIDGSGFTADRCNIHDVTDAIHTTGSNVTVQGCYIHDLSFHDDDGDHAGDGQHPYWSHNDGWQTMGGTNLNATGNYFGCYASTTTGMPDTLVTSGVPNRNWPNGITISPTGGTVGMTVDRCWFDGGQRWLQAPAQGKGYDTGNTVTIKDCTGNADQLPYNAGGPSVQVYWTTTMGTFNVTGCTYSDSAQTPSAWRGQPLNGPFVIGGSNQTQYKLDRTEYTS